MGEENGYLAQIDLRAGRRAAHRRDDLLHRAFSNERDPAGRLGTGPGLDAGPRGTWTSWSCSELMEAGARDPTWLRHPRSHHSHHLDTPRFRDDGEDRPRRWSRRSGSPSRRLRDRVKAVGGVRHGRRRRTDRERDQRRHVRGFGAIGALPFSRAAFEATIERGGVGVAPSLRAFSAGYEGDTGADSPETSRAARAEPRDISGLIAQADSWVPVKAREIVRVGVERMVDYQDLDYARSYLSRLERVAATEKRFGDGSDRLFTETARFLALGMGYEDTIRVAELKTRQARFERVRQEVQAKDGQIVEIAEYMHPRLQEIAETVPAPLGRLLLKKGPVRWAVERLTSKGRVIKTTSISGFVILSAVASLRPLRARSLRYEAEQAHLSAWLDKVIETAALNYDLGVEVAECLNLVKGYGDTHERGHANYSAILQTLPVLATRPDAAASVAALRQAALADDTGAALRNLLDRFSVHAPPNPSKSSPSAVGKAA